MDALTRSGRLIAAFARPAQLNDAAYAWVAFAAAALLYLTLQGELPYHDAARFTDQVAAKVFVWDIAHILLQPVAMLLHKWTSLPPVQTLKLLSSFSTAAAVGVFLLLLLRLSLPRWQAVVATIILACCCSVLTLAPSAHPKLVAFPFINGAFLCFVLAERTGFEKPPFKLLIAGGVLLGVAAGFLASALATAPFVALAVMLAARRDGERWTPSLAYGAIASIAAGLTFLCIVCFGYIALTGQALTPAGLIGSVASKAELRPASIPPLVYVARVAFGSVNNLVAVPGLGATVQAFMRGQIQAISEYKGLLPILGIWLSAGILIVAIYGRAVLALRRSAKIYVCLAFLIGAQAWTVWYGLNDPEHWFMLTAPTIVLFLLAMPQSVIRILLPTWAVVGCAANFALLAVPVASYPLASNEAKLSTVIGPKDVLVQFAHYPGRPYVGFYNLPGVRRISVDLRIEEAGVPVEVVLKSIDIAIAQALSQGSRVVVADILDAQDWEAPWMSLLGRGISKTRVEQTILHSRDARRIEDLGGIKLWELRPIQSAAKQ